MHHRNSLFYCSSGRPSPAQGGPAEFWPQGEAWAQNLLKVGGFPQNVLKTTWFWKNLGGRGARPPTSFLGWPCLGVHLRVDTPQCQCLIKIWESTPTQQCLYNSRLLWELLTIFLASKGAAENTCHLFDAQWSGGGCQPRKKMCQLEGDAWWKRPTRPIKMGGGVLVTLLVVSAGQTSKHEIWVFAATTGLSCTDTARALHRSAEWRVIYAGGRRARRPRPMRRRRCRGEWRGRRRVRGRLDDEVLNSA